MDQVAMQNAEVALLGLHLSLAERNGHDVATMLAEIAPTAAAVAASEAGL